ncbi:MAG: TrkA C-terminal domain-containing protein [Acidobacteriota bacterium]
MGTLIDFLNNLPLAGLMLVVALGFTLGRLEWREASLGPAGGTLLVALLFGALGLDFEHLYSTEQPRITVGAFGFALFMYSVGFEAGPRFFSSLRERNGWRFPCLAVTVNLFAIATAWLVARAFDFEASIAAGLLAGALTSAPTFAAAREVCADPDALALAFGLTFPIGLVGLVWLTQALPRVMRDDLARDARPDDADGDGESGQGAQPMLRRAFNVENPSAVDRTLAELDLIRRTGCYVTRLHRGSQVWVPDGATRLRLGDHVMARGRLEQLNELEAAIGPEVYDDDLRRRLPSPRAVVVTEGDVIGKRLEELSLFREHRTLVTEVQRHGVSLEPSATLTLARDDVVLVIGQRDDLRPVARALGHFERSSRETDIAIYAGGILIGLLIGQLSVRVGDLTLGLGNAVGLLLTGVLLGRFRRIGPWSAHVPTAARQLVRDLGILLFVAETAVSAGGSRIDALAGQEIELLISAAAVTLLPVTATVLAGRLALRMRPVEAWGSVAGGMTSSSALTALRRAADSSEPAVSYTAAYAVGSVLATLAGRALVALL